MQKLSVLSVIQGRRLRNVLLLVKEGKVVPFVKTLGFYFLLLISFTD